MTSFEFDCFIITLMDSDAQETEKVLRELLQQQKQEMMKAQMMEKFMQNQVTFMKQAVERDLPLNE